MNGNGNNGTQKPTELERRRAVLEKLRKASSEEVLALAVRAGIYTPDGQLTEEYRSDGEASASRPHD